MPWCGSVTARWGFGRSGWLPVRGRCIMNRVLLKLVPHLSPAWAFIPPAVVFAWGCALEKLASGLERLLSVRDRQGGGGERRNGHVGR